MNIIKIENKQLFLTINLDECVKCHKPMLKGYDRGHLNSILLLNFQRNGGCIEHHQDFGICDKCVENGDFPRECEICMENRSFPKEFKYIVTIYPKYADDDTRYKYVCKNCCNKNANEVMNLLAESDKTEII